MNEFSNYIFQTLADFGDVWKYREINFRKKYLKKTDFYILVL